MAESKKTSGSSKKNKELADQLRLAAELLDGAQEQPAEAAPAKKPAAKKTSGSSSGAKKSPAKKPAAKSTAGKSTATKSATAKKKSTPKATAPEKEQPEEEPVAPTVEEPTPAPAAEEPVAEQQAAKTLKCANCGTEFPEGTRFCMNCGHKLEEPAPAPVAEEPVAATEQPAQEQPPVQESATEQPAPAKEPAAKGNKVEAFAKKSSSIINKIKLPLFIVANVLLLLSSLFIIIGAFGFAYDNNGVHDKFTCSLFQYFGNADLIISWMQGTAGTWAKGGYVMVGILMWVAFLLPLALIAKNVTLAILKKNLEVHMLDAIITVAFLIAYLGIINMYGANMTWGHILALILALVLLVYTVFVLLIENRNGPFPFFSLANMVLILLCMFLLCATHVYDASGHYAAYSAGLSGGGGFAFIMLLVALAALVLLFIMQVRKLPAKVEYLLQFIVPAVAGGCALVALISYAGGKPDGLGMGGGFVFGAILTLLFAAADIVFAVVPQLHKFNVKVTDRMPKAQPTAEQAATTVPVAPTEQPTQTEQAVQEQPTQEQPAQEQPVKEQPATPQQTVRCESCGTENAVGEVFCKRCGRKLK